jgi:dihydroorotate dehydrogenase (NAD+) catalytic subunit
MLHEPFYNPEKSYEENFNEGPFGAFADGEDMSHGTLEKPFPVEPKFEFFGYKVHSPFGIPAGPLVNAKFCRAAMEKGFDIVTYKTVRSAPYPSHPWPNVLSVKVDGDLTLEKAQEKLVGTHEYQEPISITNSFGVPSFDPEFWKRDINELLEKILEGQGQVLVASFQGTKREGQGVEGYINDFRECAKILREINVPVVEVNLSCPNEGTNNLLCYDADRSLLVVQAIKEVLEHIPLIIKIGYYPDQEVLKNFVEKVGKFVDGISAINTISAPIVDVSGAQALPGEGRERSGVCGASIKWAGLDMVAKLKKLREELGMKYKIIGVGGVTTVNDFFEYRETGADYVMSATGAMWNPYLAKEIKERLYLKK